MQLNLKTVIGHKLSATDGDIGHVDDCYFDDNTWAVCYMVVNTGTWRKERKVLLLPQSFRRSAETGQILTVDLTRDQIGHSPSVNQHRPVSGQRVAEYYRNNGWPARWQGQRLWGTTDPPFVASRVPSDRADAGGIEEASDANLHSTQTVTGYQIEATDGVIGTVSGFVLDDQTWSVDRVLVAAGHWYAGREISLPPGRVERIIYLESKVCVRLTKDELRHTGDHAFAPDEG